MQTRLRRKPARRAAIAAASVIALAALGFAALPAGATSLAGAFDPPTTASRNTPALIALGRTTTPPGQAVDATPPPAAPTTTAPAAVTTSPTTPPTTVPATSPSTTISSSPPTVTAPATTLPTSPIASPLDPHTQEPLIELGGITIPRLGVDAPLLEGIRLPTLDRGPGHWPGTAMPGENGNVVVDGHRTSHGAPFRDLDQLVPGDLVVFDTAGGIDEYVVTGTQVVEPDALWIVEPTDQPTATLFACHPLGSTSHRIVVNLELAR
ncbi:MAG: sortase [Ilumatobacteraceae bacterium]